MLRVLRRVGVPALWRAVSTAAPKAPAGGRAIAATLGFAAAGGLVVCAAAPPPMEDVEDLLPGYTERLAQAQSHHDLFVRLASVVKAGEPFMTTRDFLRSVLFPQLFYSAGDDLPDVSNVKLFKHIGDADGLISFSEFVLLKALLCVPDDHIEVAFHMFDTDDSGTLSPDEVHRVVSSLSRRAAPHDSVPEVTCLPARLGVRLFGKGYLSDRARGRTSISPHAFKDFLLELRRAQLAVKFNYFGSEGTMTAFEFGRFLVAHAEPYSTQLFLSRLQPLHSIDSVKFTFEDFVAFDYALNGYSDDIRDALQLYLVSSGSCSLTVFERAVVIAAGVKFPRPITQTLFTVFNSNDDASQLAVSDLNRVFRLYSGDTRSLPKALTGIQTIDAFVACMKEDM